MMTLWYWMHWKSPYVLTENIDIVCVCCLLITCKCICKWSCLVVLYMSWYFQSRLYGFLNVNDCLESTWSTSHTGCYLDARSCAAITANIIWTRHSHLTCQYIRTFVFYTYLWYLHNTGVWSCWYIALILLWSNLPIINLVVLQISWLAVYIW